MPGPFPQTVRKALSAQTTPGLLKFKNSCVRPAICPCLHARLCWVCASQGVGSVYTSWLCRCVIGVLRESCVALAFYCPTPAACALTVLPQLLRARRSARVAR